MKQATVIGLGRSGIAAAKLLIKHGYAVTISDSNQNASLETQKQQLETLGINIKLGDKFSPTTEATIVVSPGVPWDIAPLVRAREMGIETIFRGWRLLVQMVKPRLRL
jgi:UDP-N-acetylmuramoylalanine--D-glutamate ligase